MAVVLSLNSSAALIKKVTDAISSSGILPEQLEIELTETVAMTNEDHSSDVFRELRDIGVRMSIDDFGTGYASMSYLRKLPFDKLKIDREFVQDVHKLRGLQAICNAVLALAESLDLDVLAEGVEDVEDLDLLQNAGCSYFQGFYFSKPVPAEDYMSSIDRIKAFRGCPERVGG